MEELKRAYELHMTEQHKGAAAIYKSVLVKNPHYLPALWPYACMLHDTGQLEAAQRLYSDVLLYAGNDLKLKAFAHNHLGRIAFRNGHFAHAMNHWESALQFYPKLVSALVSLGSAHRIKRNFPKAIQLQGRALSLDNNNPAAHYEVALIALTQGDLQRGFFEYEYRWRWDKFPLQPLITEKPKWNGQNCTGKTVLLWGEQGFGDNIHFIRYAKLVKKRGATVLVLCRPELVRLFESVEGVDAVMVSAEGVDFDFHSPLMSLPRVFKTTLRTIPADVPYIWSATPQRKEFTIGIVWAGQACHCDDQWRSVPLETFKTLFDVPGVRWCSFQCGPRANEVDRFPHIEKTSASFRDFQDTADALGEIDLLISVDTSVAHLAGAAGRPVWALLSHTPDWRWMLEGDTTPWYPTMRLFRQSPGEDWASVIERVKQELVKIVKNQS